MRLSKYKKEYKRFRQNSLKSYFILDNLIYEIIKTESTKNEKIKYILHSFKRIRQKFVRLIDDIDSFNFDYVRKKKVKKQKPLNNLVVLPLYEDIDIYVDPNYNIGKIFKKDDNYE